jgi:hypothetical protein
VTMATVLHLHCCLSALLVTHMLTVRLSGSIRRLGIEQAWDVPRGRCMVILPMSCRQLWPKSASTQGRDQSVSS